ncbi:uncharacterized protein F5147DRAFT_837520 [Suillus discolor]|uniref:DUF6533 domain-containing protein n=1 Tax=Suillus discolor TaxID=1912936 RepID=A0A9P7F643_9AGAM|nr:uncharacterized protein F5147DRAFT_837520 [Suillus discolor]KAG2107278.1 hypothetical protein F5147DRAFT_837520 [Suillus discolor]
MALDDNPGWWMLVNLNRDYTDYIAASSVVVAYDWALTFGQEVDLVWRQRWSSMTALFLGLRYIGVLYAAYVCLTSRCRASDRSFTISVFVFCEIINSALWCTGFVVNGMLGVIMITRLFAMHQQSRKVLIFLVVIFLAITIACGVIVVIETGQILGEDLILPGTHQCLIGGNIRLAAEYWLLGTAWEVFTLCLVLWSVVKHFRELHEPWTRWTIGNCFTVLVKTHVLYFASFATVSCLQLGYLSPAILDPINVGTRTYGGVLQIFSLVQMFILGPRLILDVRKYYAKIVAKSDAGIAMTPIVFHESVQESTSSTMATPEGILGDPAKNITR